MAEWSCSGLQSRLLRFDSGFSLHIIYMIKIIAEIGINFGGEISVAKDLILQASKSGCWGVKFQFRDSESFYFSDQEIGDAIVRNEIIKNNLSFDQISELQNYSQSLGLKFGMSFFREYDLKLYLENLKDADFYKVPSAECTNIALINAILQRGRKLFISTGGHILDDVLKLFSNDIYKDVVIMHCIANYPACLGVQNLEKITKISKTHNAGYSSHDVDSEVCIAAMVMGARYIERHLTNDKNGPGLDDSTSSDKNEMHKICKFAEFYSGIFGSDKAPPNQGEILNMQNLGTGLYSKNSFERGTVLSLNDFHIAAPRKGISAGDFQSFYSGKKIKRDLSKGSPLTKSTFIPEIKQISADVLNRAQEKKITVPVRIHDLNKMRFNVGTGCYEFHLSYDEVLSDDLTNLVSNCNSEELYSIHLPDYIPNNRIFNPISSDKDIKEISKKILSRTENLAYGLEQLTGKKVPIVGSFSQRDDNHETFFHRLNEEVIERSSQYIYPQWLPVNAWYFGGTVKLDVFNNEYYIDLIEKHNMEICLDICHVILSANTYKASYNKWIERLLPYSSHFHLAEAEGEDGEGLQFGTGLPIEYSKIINQNKMCVIEVWQGHFDKGHGFKEAIKYLDKHKEI